MLISKLNIPCMVSQQLNLTHLILEYLTVGLQELAEAGPNKPVTLLLIDFLINIPELGVK